MSSCFIPRIFNYILKDDVVINKTCTIAATHPKVFCNTRNKSNKSPCPLYMLTNTKIVHLISTCFPDKYANPLFLFVQFSSIMHLEYVFIHSWSKGGQNQRAFVKTIIFKIWARTAQNLGMQMTQKWLFLINTIFCYTVNMIERLPVFIVFFTFSVNSINY